MTPYASEYEGVRLLSGTVDAAGRTMGVYLFGAGGLLIDTGSSRMIAQLTPVLRTWNLEQAVLTHYHEDHSGMGRWLTEHWNLPVLAAEATRRIVAEDAPLPDYRKAVWGPRPGFETRPLPGVVDAGIYRFHVIPTPGHSADHVSLYEPRQGWLFAGDLYVTDHPRVSMAEEVTADLLASIRRVLDLDFRVLFCAHRGVLEDGREALKRKADYLERLRERVYQLREAGLGEEDIAQTLFPQPEPLEIWSSGDFSRLNLVRACLKTTGGKTGP
ncbi:MAG: MBL fold metallo-hydrolase [Alicyclobacillaceae bacterium]|nr:MBL fold metallo-hydrolase [Alicyclobacillaceae bacterium]